MASFKNAEEQELLDMRDLRRQNMAKNPLRDMFCLCKSEFRNVMYNCQLCRDWFHEDCVPVPSATNQNGILNGGGAGPGAGSNRPKWLCPSCVRSKRPRLETILPLLVQLQQLPIRLPEDEALRCLAERAMNWQDRARKALSSPDVSAAQEAILAQQQQQKRRSEGGGVGNINSPRKPRRRTSLSKDASGSTESDDADDDDDDDDCRLRIVEDGFSNDEEEHRTAATATNATAVTNTTNSDLLKLLSDSEIENLLDLMMEGDLLEVSLDETHELWRILETMPPTLLEAEAMERVAMHLQRQRQQPPPNPLATNSGAEDSNDSLLVQNSSPNSNSNSGGATASANNNNNNNGGRNKNKRRSNDASGNSAVPRKKQNTPKQTPGKKGTGATAGRKSDASKASPAASAPGVAVADADAENKQANGGNTNSNTGAATGGTTTPTAPGSAHKKRKRISTTTAAANNNNNSNTNNSNNNSNANSNPAQAAATAGSNNTTGGGGQKKHAQRSQQAAQEDDEEECRAENCHKPTGREVDWVQCDGGCNEWFHMYCVGLIRSQIKADDDYICIRCTKTVAVAALGSGAGATTTPTTTPGKQRTAAQSAR